MLSKHRVIVEAGSNKRTVLTIHETKHGDVYIRLHCGVNYGDTNTDAQIKELRFSIHPSVGSSSNTIKRTTHLSDGRRLNQHSYTSCIKNRTGFAHLFTYIASDMSTPAHDISATKRETHLLAAFDHSKYTLAFSVFVGSADTVFIQSFGLNTFLRIVSGTVQLIVVASAFSFTSTPFGRLLEEVEAPPGGFVMNPNHNTLLGIRRGYSPDECIDFHFYRSNHLMFRLMEILLSLGSDNEYIAILNSIIDSFSSRSAEDFMIPRGGDFYCRAR